MSAEEKVDHAATAQVLLGALNGQPVELARSFSAAAQAHATLALVEQQRIANKVAVAQVAQLGEIARLLTGPDYPRDPALPSELILTPEDEKLLEG